LELIAANPRAFILAYFIASRARWHSGFNRLNLNVGEAAIGDHEAMGMTAQQYRTAKAQLAQWGFATFRTTNRGTIARLSDSRLFDIGEASINKLDNSPSTIPATVKQQVTYKDNKERKEPVRVLLSGLNAVNKDIAAAKNGIGQEKVSAPDFVPPNLDEVRQHLASLHPVWRDFAFIWREKMTAANWLDHKGKPVRDWKALAASFADACFQRQKGISRRQKIKLEN
jgi:hypothetical protein